MSKKPTQASVTDIQCTCEYLQHAAERAELPIEYDKTTNEYHFSWRSENSDNNQIVLYHCPWCGGAAPRSKRDSLFASVSDAEARRLDALFANVKTLDLAIERLGLPDVDSPQGASIQIPEKEGSPPSMRYFRTLTYTRLSETADVRLTAYRHDRIAVEIIGKPLVSV